MNSKMEMLEHAIAERDDLEVVIDIQNNSVLEDLEKGRQPRVQRDLYLAMIEPVYEHRQLDEIAKSICPDVVPDTAKYNRAGYDDGQTWWKVWSGLVIGVRRYTEYVGKASMMAALDEPSMQYMTLRPGEVGMVQFAKPVVRTTTVRLYPDSDLADIGYVVNDGHSNLLPAREVRASRRKHKRLGKLGTTQLVET